MTLIDQLNQQKAISYTSKRLRSYLVTIIDAGLRLPADKKGPNRTLIADAAGISRQAFYPGRGASDTCSMFDWAVEHVGINSLDAPIRLPQCANNPTVTYLARALKDVEKQLSKAYEQLLKKDVEISELRRQLREGERKLKAMRVVQEYREKGYEILL